MEFRKMVMTTMYVTQQKRQRCIEQSFGLVGEGEGGMIWENGIKTCIISYKKRIPVQVWCRIQEAWGWCTGMNQRDGMGREVGGGFRMGNTCTPMADACWCMAKPIQYCKVKKINKIIIKKKIWVNNLLSPGSNYQKKDFHAIRKEQIKQKQYVEKWEW